MGAFDVIPNIVIPDPDDAAAEAAFRKKWKWEPHEQIIVKGTYTSAEQEPVENAGSTLAGKDKVPTLRAGSARTKLLEVMIVDWTLAQNGHKVEVSPATIKRLPSNYRTPVLEVCDEIAAGMSEEEQEAFLSSSNGHLKDDSVATNQSLSLS